MNVLQLRGEDIDGDHISCTGRQVAMILTHILSMQDSSDLSWYAAALESYQPIFLYQDRRFVAISDFNSLIEQLRSTDQLLDGIIVAVYGLELPKSEDEIITADGPMCKLVTDSFIEIHIFDTSWIEIYTGTLQIISNLQKRFGGRLLPTEV